MARFHTLEGPLDRTRLLLGRKVRAVSDLAVQRTAAPLLLGAQRRSERGMGDDGVHST